MAVAVFPPCLAWGQYCWPTPKLLAWDSRTLRASPAQCLVGTVLLSLGSQYTKSFVCALQESVSPVLWKFYNQVPLASMSPSVPKVLFEPSECLWQVWGLFLNMILPLVPLCWGFSFALECRVFFFFLVGSSIFLSMVVQQRLVILKSSQEMSSDPSTSPSHSRTLFTFLSMHRAEWLHSVYRQMSTSSSVFMLRALPLHQGPSRSSCFSFLSHTWSDMVPCSTCIPNMLASHGPLSQSIRDWGEEGKLLFCNIFFIDSFLYQ